VTPALRRYSRGVPAELTADTLEAHVGTAFTVVDGDQSIVMRLAAVQRGPVRRHGERTEPFSIVFSAPKGTTWPQRIYSFEHPELGTNVIFVVPIGPGPDQAMLYEAVFN
jgi:uncharacterized protein DUF6916